MIQRVDEVITQVSKYRLSITPDKTIEADIIEVPLDDLKLDPKNVRFRHLLKPLRTDEMIDFIWKESDTKKLYQQIVYSQGLSEQPIIDSNFIVKEGNMRTVCLWKLREKILEDEIDIPLEKIDPVRVILLPDDIEESDIAILLTRHHVTGKTEWKALNQAAQIYDLYTRHGFSYDKIADSCGIGKLTAMRQIQAYELVLAYHQDYPNDLQWVTRYSYFYELVKKKELKKWSDDFNDVALFMKWIHDGQIAKGAEVRILPQIISNENAYNEMRNGATVQEALEVLGREKPEMTSKSFKTIRSALEELRLFPRSELIDTIRNPAKMKMLETLHDELGTLIRDIKTVSEK